MLLDGILHRDQCRAALADLYLSWLSFHGGIAQGRKSSVHMYNTAAVALRDIVLDASVGVSVPRDMWASRVLARAEDVAPCLYQGPTPSIAQAAVDMIRNCNGSVREAGLVVSALEHRSDRLIVAESACLQQALIFQQADDLLGPTSSAQQMSLFWRACESYTNKHGPRFNIGPTKSAALPLGVDETERMLITYCTYQGRWIPVVDVYTYMGICLDKELWMRPHLDQTLSRMRVAFNRHLAVGLKSGLPMQILASVLHYGPTAVGNYGMALCLCAEGAEARLNQLQIDWCNELMFIRGLPQGVRFALLAECGQSRRLGTQMLAAAIMLEARVLLLAVDMPPRLILESARAALFPSRAKEVIKMRSTLGIPDLLEHLGSMEVDRARKDNNIRERDLVHYRKNIVDRSLEGYDQSAFTRALRNQAWPYIEFQSALAPLPENILLADWDHDDWTDYAIWSLARASGRWPWAPLGIYSCPAVVDHCPLCNVPEATLEHLLWVCQASQKYRQEFVPANVFSWKELRTWLFTHRPREEDTRAMRYVAVVTRKAADALLTASSPVSEATLAC